MYLSKYRSLVDRHTIGKPPISQSTIDRDATTFLPYKGRASTDVSRGIVRDLMGSLSVNDRWRISYRINWNKIFRASSAALISFLLI